MHSANSRGTTGENTTIGRADARRAQLHALGHRRHAEAPRVEHLERPAHPHGPQSVAVSFDHRQQAGA